MNILLTDINETRKTGLPSFSVCRLPFVALWRRRGCRPSDQGWLPASGVRRLAPGFTLIELLLVMVVAAIIMSVSLPSFIGMGRGSGMRTAVNNVSSTIALSRQWAITHREQITFFASTTGMVYTTNNVLQEATNNHACYYAISEGVLVQSITDLPLDVTFNDKSPNVTSLVFKTDGGLAGGSETKKIVLADKNKPLETSRQKTISINGLTGGIKVE
ncbi:MAG: prepilin-type N-terminal cleavage/methylation domain-containing protein [Kiritimatiellae bacterium]|nr:prepilin-type N-terminal cleavage/methylation domain-containing protein [Kiritimatiellia bacterium]